MPTIKLRLIVFLFTFYTGCAIERESDVDGFYYGRFKTPDLDYPQLVRFGNTDFVDYFSVPSDSFLYKRRGNVFKFQNALSGDAVEMKLVRKDEQLLFYRPNADTLVFMLSKRESSHFLFDYLRDKHLKIELPEGAGKTETIGQSFRFDYPLYFAQVDGKLLVNFMDSTVQFDDNYYKFLLATRKAGADWNTLMIPVTFMADKNLAWRDINRLREQLWIAGYSRVSYVLASPEYDRINFISRYLPPLSEVKFCQYFGDYHRPGVIIPPLPPPSPELWDIANIGFVFESDNGQYLIANQPVSNTELQVQIKETLRADSKSVVAYHITSNSNYQDYIDLLRLVTGVYDDLRDEYLMTKYKPGELENTDDRYEDARNAIPMKIVELDSTEYSVIQADFSRQ